MKQFRNPFRGKACVVTAILLCGLFICRPVMAGERGFFAPRRALGLAFLSVGEDFHSITGGHDHSFLQIRILLQTPEGGL